MSDSLIANIFNLFETELEIQVPTVSTDMLEEGLLDSMVFVDLIVHLETRFQIEIPIDQLEFEQFRTVTGIADLVTSLMTPAQCCEQESAA